MLRGLVADAFFFGKEEESSVLDVCLAFEDECYHI